MEIEYFITVFVSDDERMSIGLLWIEGSVVRAVKFIVYDFAYWLVLLIENSCTEA